jgi:hypothetical protein
MMKCWNLSINNLAHGKSLQFRLISKKRRVKTVMIPKGCPIMKI